MDAELGELTRKIVEASREGIAGEQGTSFPLPSWYASSTPPERDVAAFRAIVWRRVRLRSLDDLRKHYVREKAARMQPGEASDQPRELDAERLLLALAKRIDELNDDERALLLEDETDRGEPLSNAERQRLFRLRRRLADRVKSDLGMK